MLVVCTVNAEHHNFTATSEPVTKRVDGTDITGVMTYKFYGGDQGSSTMQEWISPIPSITETVELSGNIAEFYMVACEDDLCGAQSNRVTNQYVRATPGTGTLTIKVEW